MTNILSIETKLFAHVAMICNDLLKCSSQRVDMSALLGSFRFDILNLAVSSTTTFHSLNWLCFSRTCGPLQWSGQEPGLEATLSLSSRQGQCRPAIMMQKVKVKSGVFLEVHDQIVPFQPLFLKLIPNISVEHLYPLRSFSRTAFFLKKKNQQLTVLAAVSPSAIGSTSTRDCLPTFSDEDWIRIGKLLVY